MHSFNKKVLYSNNRDVRKSLTYQHVSLVDELFLNDKEYQYQLNQSDEGSDVDDELRKQKKQGRQALDKSVFKDGLEFLGKTASGVGYAYLGLNLQDKGIFSIIVRLALVTTRELRATTTCRGSTSRTTTFSAWLRCTFSST
jgi:hypothetical protein